MKRSPVSLIDITEWSTLGEAYYLAARGKRRRAEVRDFGRNLEKQLAELGREIREGRYQPLPMSCFRIRDPKPRTIHAPCFRDRVAHHAIMLHVGPVLERALVFDTYACRKGKGTLAAVERCQHFSRRFPWFVKIDIRSFFATIDHSVLKGLLQTRLKNKGLLSLLAVIIDSCQTDPGKGLPIGALTSQHFANFYLAGLDRLLLEKCRVKGMIRYMDDVVWWNDDRQQAKDVLDQVDIFVRNRLGLEIKANLLINRSALGVPFCGYRVLPSCLRLSRRKRHRYALHRERWENAYLHGNIDATGLQAGYSSAFAITCQADAAGWRAEQLRRRPVHPLLEEG